MLHAEASLTAATDELAELVTSLSRDDITDKARHAARLCILDLVGCAVAGFTAPPATATRKWAAQSQPAGDASLWLTGETSSLLGAGISNAAAGCALDGDDLHWESILHAGASLVPAALAVAEDTGASGEELLDALVIGYEVACRIGASVDWDTLGQIATGSWSGWGTAAVRARLQGASASTLAESFAIVGALRPVVLPPGVTINRNGIKEGIAWGTYVGLAAHQLAACGLTGPRECLDNELLSRDRMLADGGGRFEVEAVDFKPYVCCAWTHAATDALLGLMADHDLRAEDISDVHVTTFTTAITMLDNGPNPQTVQAAQYNIPWVLAVAAHDGKPGLLPLSEETLGRPELTEFASRVSLEASTEYDAALPENRPAKVALVTRKGTFERKADREASPSDLRGVAEKFRLMARRAWSGPRQEAVIDAVTSLSGDIAPLTDLLRAVPDAAAGGGRH